MICKKHNIIYKTTNLTNGKVYIGVHSTDNLDDGYIGCGIYSQGSANRDTPLHAAVRKYGYENFKRETLYEFGTAELCFWYESFLVDQDFVSRDDNYNAGVGGRGGDLGEAANRSRRNTVTGVPKSTDHKAAIAEALVGKKKSDTHRMNMCGPRAAITGDKHPLFGKPRSEETKSKIRATLQRSRQAKEAQNLLSV